MHLHPFVLVLAQLVPVQVSELSTPTTVSYCTTRSANNAELERAELAPHPDSRRVPRDIAVRTLEAE